MGISMAHVNTVIVGVFSGAAYALVAVSVTLMFRSTGVLSFAHAAFAATGAYLYAELAGDRGLPRPLAALVALAVTVAYGLAVERFSIRPVRHAGSATKLMATVGVLSLTTGLLLQFFGFEPTTAPLLLPDVNVALGSLRLPQWALAAKSTGLFKPGLRVAVLYDTQFIPIGSYVPFIKASWENAGAKVVSADPFNLTDGDCTSLVLKMRQLQVDWWDFQALGWVLCASAASRQQYRPAVGWGGWPTSVAGLASQVGPWVEGMWGAGIGDHTDGRPRTKTAAHDEYATAIRTYHPRLSSMDHLESPVTIFGWMGAKVLAAAIAAQGRTVTKAGINQWISGTENFDSGIAPPIGSMAPNCKTASEVAWFGRWHWDADKRQAVRVPETGYYPSDQKDKFGGRCFLTKIADSFD